MAVARSYVPLLIFYVEAKCDCYKKNPSGNVKCELLNGFYGKTISAAPVHRIVFALYGPKAVSEGAVCNWVLFI